MKKKVIVALLAVSTGVINVLACTDTPTEVAPPEVPEPTVVTYTDGEAYSSLISGIERVLADPEHVSLNAEMRGQSVEQTRKELEGTLARFREAQSSPMASTSAHCSGIAELESYGTAILPSFFGNVEIFGWTEAVEPSRIKAELHAEKGREWYGAPGAGYWQGFGEAPETEWKCYDVVSVSIFTSLPNHRPFYIWAMTIHRLWDNDNNETKEVTEDLLLSHGHGGGPVL